MSRIHEALKKAEQERALGLPQPAAVDSAPAGDQGEIFMPASDVRAEVFSGPQTVAATPTTRELLSFEALEAACLRTEWRPDPKKALFLNSHDDVAGLEEFRKLRTRLHQIRQKQRLQTILISSALAAEGKTFVSANLAQIMVRQHGRRALLIDADLRRSQLHTVLGAPASPGLTDYLRGKVDESGVIQCGPQQSLFFIPGGSLVTNPTELLANGRLKRLLDRVGTAFDWIILDSPPVVPVSDASILADVCDGVLLVLRAAATPVDMAQKAQLEFKNKPILGVVLNRVEPTASYSNYYYHGYKQGPGKKAGKN